MKKINNPILIEINEVFEEYEKLRETGEGYNDRQNELSDKAFNLFMSNASNFSPQDLIEGFYYGTDSLQRITSGLMIDDDFFHPAYLDIMVRSIKEDKFDSNYKFIFTLQKRLSREKLVEILKISVLSHDYKVQVNSLSVVREEVLVELIPDVEKLCNLPDINPEEVFVPDYFTFDSNLYIDHIKRNRTSIRDDAIKTLQLLKENRKE